MSYFVFKEYNSNDDLIIRNPIVRPSWFKDFSEIETGSVSKIIQFSHSYSNAVLSVDAVIKDTCSDRLKVLYSTIRGLGRLTLSNNFSEYINAVASMSDPIGVSPHMAETTINFTLLPFCYAVESSKFMLTSECSRIVNRGDVFAAPLISFTASDSNVIIDINGAEFIIRLTDSDIDISGREIFVDCDLQDTYYYDDMNKISINRLTYGSYPFAEVGEGAARIIGDVTNAILDMRERWF